MTASTWRIAAGTCVIVVGVLVAGGPIARADSDSAPSQASGGSSAGGNEQPSQPASTTKATKEAKATKTGRPTPLHVSTTIGIGSRRPAQSGSSGSGNSTATPSTPPRSKVGATRVNRSATAPTGDTAPSSATAPPSATAAASALAAAIPQAIAPVLAAVTSAETQIGPTVTTAVTTVGTLVQGVVQPVAELVAILPELAASLTSSLGDFHVSLVIGVAGLPSTGETIVVSGPSSAERQLPTAAPQFGPAPFGATGTPAPVPASTQPAARPVAVPYDLVAALGAAGASVPNAPVATSTASPGGGNSFLKTYGGLVDVAVAVSLAALVAAAFPGVLGIFLPTAAGARIGYRQAKAHGMIRGASAARFAATGPVGIVRSGNLVTLRTRPSGLERAHPAELGQQVA